MGCSFFETGAQRKASCTTTPAAPPIELNDKERKRYARRKQVERGSVAFTLALIDAEIVKKTIERMT